MSTDTPSGESGDSALTIDGAAQAFAELIEPSAQAEPEQKVDTEIDPPKKKEGEAEAPEAEPNAQEEGADPDDQMVTVKIEGKDVEISLRELKNGYQKDKVSTERFMQAAETRKLADAEIQKAHSERVEYARKLTGIEAQLVGALEQQQNIDWAALARDNPAEWVNQQNLLQQRQSALGQARQEMAKVNEQFAAETAKARQERLGREQQELLVKLPDWKDPSKAKAEGDAIRAYLQTQGYALEETNVEDHRAVLLGRKAMLYDQMLNKAQAAAKKVSNLPEKVVRPGVTTERNPLDGRTALAQNHAKSQSIDSAAALFSSLFS